MSRINNSFHLTGHLGASPEIRYNPQSGEPIARLALAVNHHYRDRNSGERMERVDWLDLTVYFQSLVEVVQKYCHKGTQIQVRGHLRKRVWESTERRGEDGQPRKESRVELIVSELLLLGRPKGSEGRGEVLQEGAGTLSGGTSGQEALEDLDGDVPL